MQYSEYAASVTYSTTRKTFYLGAHAHLLMETQLNVKILYDTTQIHVIIILFKVNQNQMHYFITGACKIMAWR